MTTRYLCIILPLLITLCASCKSKQPGTSEAAPPQGLRGSTAALADSVVADGFLSTPSLGRIPGEAPAYTRRHKLMEVANEEELLLLTQHDHALMRVVGFEGLYRKGYPHMEALLERALDDNATVHYLRGDISMYMPALEYLYTYVLSMPMPGEELPDQALRLEGGFMPDRELAQVAVERIRQYRTLRR